MSKRVFVLESEDLGSAIIDYVRRLIGENPDTDRGRYSLTFIPNVEDGIMKFKSAKVERISMED